MKKINTTGFWISLSGAVLLVLQQLGQAFGFNVNSDIFNGIVSSVCSVMVVLGILIPTKKENNDIEEKSENTNSKDNDADNT